MNPDGVSLPDGEHYSRALDEIYRLRTLLAYEAGVIAAHLGYKTFPKTRRPVAGEQIARMKAAAQGMSDVALASRASVSLRHARREAGMPDTLTRSQWEAEAPRRSPR